MFRASVVSCLLCTAIACGGSEDPEPEVLPTEAGSDARAPGGSGGTAPSFGGTPALGGAGGAGGAEPTVGGAAPVDAGVDAGGTGGAAVVEAGPPPEVDAGPCADGVQGAGEEGVDCGFLVCPGPCATGSTCVADADCGAGTCVRGVCASTVASAAAGDLILSASGSPYALTTDVDVSGALVVEPGVVVFGGGHRVRATDVAIAGTATERVALEDLTLDAGGASSTTVGTIRLHHVDVFGGSLMLVPGEARYYRFEMTHCRVRDSEYLYLWFPHGQTVIETNIFYATGGISVGLNLVNGGAAARIASNYFEAMALPSGSAGFLELWSSVGDATLTAELNTFADLRAPTLSLRNDASRLVGTNNYWGTQESFVVQQMIHDRGDDPSLAATIPYAPVLATPDPSAPTLSGFPVVAPPPPDAGADGSPVGTGGLDGGSDGGS